MVNFGNFNTEQHSRLSNFELLPEGWYKTVITNVYEEMKNDGSTAIVIMLSVIEGFYKGCNLRTNLNLQSANPKQVYKSEQTLTSICLAVGVKVLKTEQQLLNIPFWTKVVQTADASGTLYCNARNYASCEEFEAQDLSQKTQPTEVSPPQSPNAAVQTPQVAESVNANAVNPAIYTGGTPWMRNPS